jgi:hypothetical protein
MTDHPQWLVVAECPGGAGRDFGISVLHRKCTDPDAAWTEDAEELEQNARCDRGEGEKYSRVAGGDDWRSLMITLLRDVEKHVAIPLRSNNVFVMGCAESGPDHALESAIMAHLNTALNNGGLNYEYPIR